MSRCIQNIVFVVVDFISFSRLVVDNNDNDDDDDDNGDNNKDDDAVVDGNDTGNVKAVTIL